MLKEDNIAMFSKICTNFSKTTKDKNKLSYILRIFFKKQMPKSIFFIKNIKNILESDYLSLNENEVEHLISQENEIIDKENKENKKENDNKKNLIKSNNLKIVIIQFTLVHSILNKILKTVKLKHKQNLLKQYKIANNILTPTKNKDF